MMQHQLDSSTIQRLIEDEELAPILDDMVSEASVSTQAGYKHVLNQFIYSEAATSKVEQWEKDAAAAKEKAHDAAENPTRRLTLTSGFHRLARSSSVVSSLALELDNSDQVEPADKSPIDRISIPPKRRPTPIARKNSSELRASTESIGSITKLFSRKGSSISSFVESIGSISINLNLKEELEPRTQDGAFTESFSSININLNLKDELEPKRDEKPNCPLRSSRYHTEAVSRIQILEKKIDVECGEWNGE